MLNLEILVIFGFNSAQKIDFGKLLVSFLGLKITKKL